jgi:hypothetical protein
MFSYPVRLGLSSSRPAASSVAGGSPVKKAKLESLYTMLDVRMEAGLAPIRQVRPERPAKERLAWGVAGIGQCISLVSRGRRRIRG